jgi:hypothetical protein
MGTVASTERGNESKDAVSSSSSYVVPSASMTSDTSHNYGRVAFALPLPGSPPLVWWWCTSKRSLVPLPLTPPPPSSSSSSSGTTTSTSSTQPLAVTSGRHLSLVATCDGQRLCLLTPSTLYRWDLVGAYQPCIGNDLLIAPPIIPLETLPQILTPINQKRVPVTQGSQHPELTPSLFTQVISYPLVSSPPSATWKGSLSASPLGLFACASNGLLRVLSMPPPLQPNHMMALPPFNSDGSVSKLPVIRHPPPAPLVTASDAAASLTSEPTSPKLDTSSSSLPVGPRLRERYRKFI